MLDDFDFFNARYTYDPFTGNLLTKIPMHGHGGPIPIGSIAGCVVKSENRINLGINRDGKHKNYKAHRVCWLLMTGSWPPREIDHIDTDGTNNRWSNLRLCNRSQNSMNRNLQSNNTSGFKGVSRHGKGWRVMVWRERKPYCLGTYKTPDEAYAVWCKAAKELHGEFYRD